MRGLVAARAAVTAAVDAIDADIRKMARASDARRRLMTIPGVGQLTALAFAAAVDDPERFGRSRDIGACFGLVPRRYQSGELDDAGREFPARKRDCRRSAPVGPNQRAVLDEADRAEIERQGQPVGCAS